jgi:protein-L-isoaspartate(D-aspartate) O-methyltransferase
MNTVDADTKNKMKRMLEVIDEQARYTASYTGRKTFAKPVMAAMGEVIREEFVPPALRHAAYADGPLPIGHGQTISQPYIVALMTDLLELTPDSIVLEIGTGSGYQAAILSRLAKQVYTVETVAKLAESASQRFKKLGYHNIETRCADGYNGWAEKAPFDAIIVTAAASEIPLPLVEQLKPGGRMVIPVGRPYAYQELMLVTKEPDGTTQTRPILGVAFVPLVTEKE